MNMYEDLIGKSVYIKHSNKATYLKLVGLRGVVSRVSGGSIGVTIDGLTNEASTYGVFWFDRNELTVLKEGRKDTNMKEFTRVAMVRLLGYSKKDYAFALYDDEFKCIENLGSDYKDTLVVVNPNNKNDRALGTITEIYDSEYFFNTNNISVTAEIIGVVDMSGYNAREAEKQRYAEIAKKKAAIEKELEAEISKRKTMEYYETIAKEYADNPRLAELVAELKQLDTACNAN